MFEPYIVAAGFLLYGNLCSRRIPALWQPLQPPDSCFTATFAAAVFLLQCEHVNRSLGRCNMKMRSALSPASM
jgi:hypothetical protein